MSTVLVTGAARGIGKAITRHLAVEGWDVIAGVRNDADAVAVSATPRVSAVLLDVTDDEQVTALCDALPARLDAVVNNAGVVVAGPLETVSAADLRRQFDVNVVGQLAVTQAVLPRLRASRGRIVFISSVNGKVASPVLGAYSASKFALEAAADSLRMELKPWDIGVSVVQPAQTATDMWETADETADELVAAMSSAQRRLYGPHVAGLRNSISGSRELAVSPDKVAAVVGRALTARRPRARYAVGTGSALQVALIAHLPSKVSDAVLRKAFGQP